MAPCVIPTIRFARDDADAACAAVVASEAFARTGFAFVAREGAVATPDVVERCFAESRRFFARDASTKAAYARDENGVGYTAMASETLDRARSTVGDSKEGFYVVRERAKNRWPSAAFEAAATAHYDAMYALGKRLLRAFARACGVDDAYFDAHWSASSHNCVLRMLKYSATRSDEGAGAFACGAHSDYGALTILAVENDGTSGLEIYDRDTETWVPVTPPPDHFVLNVGDLLERWSNGRFASTRHRVMTTGEHERFSMPFFFEPSHDAMIEPVCVGDGEMAKFAPIRFGDYLREKYAQTYEARG
jgi:isopenicillin N synthase-like dioxygenase